MSVVQEERAGPRVPFQGRVQLELVSRQTPLEGNPLNLSEGGLCLRLEQALDLHAAVTLRLSGPPPLKPFRCAARVAWVVQRLDLRSAPPFLYDVGVEFVDPSPRLRQFVTGRVAGVRPLLPTPHSVATRQKRTTQDALKAVLIHGRCYIPTVEREPATADPWHLVVAVDGTPCFSQRYASERQALAAWTQFRRRPPKPREARVGR